MKRLAIGDFGKFSRAVRAQLGWSQQRLGDEAGSYRTTVERIESRRNSASPNLDTAISIAEAMGFYVCVVPQSKYRESDDTLIID